MKSYQLDEVQFEKLQMAQAPQPAMMLAKATDPVKDAWAQFGRELGFDPATVTNWKDDWTFDAEPTAAPAAALPPLDGENDHAQPPGDEPHFADGMAKIAAEVARRDPPAAAPLAVVEPGLADEKLQVIVRESTLSPESGNELLTRFAPLAVEAKRLLVTARTINVTTEENVGEMAMARTIRLALRAIRLRSENLRKGLKDESLKRGKAIDGLHHVVEYLISPEETRLQELEDFATIAAAARKAKLAQDRATELTALGFNPGQLDLGSMEQDAYSQLLEGQKAVAAAAKQRAAEALRDARRKKLAAVGVSPTAVVMTTGKVEEMSDPDFELLLADHGRLFREEQERKRRLGTDRFNELGTWGVQYSGPLPLAEMTQEEFDKIAVSARDAWNAKKNSEEAERNRKDEELRLSKLKSERMVTLSRFSVRIEPRLQGGVILYYADEVIEQVSTPIEKLSAEDWEGFQSVAKMRFDEQAARVKKQREKAEADKKKSDDEAAANKKRADEAQAELDRQKKAKADADKKKKADEARAARAPDKKKLEAYVAAMAAIPVPVLTTDAGKFALEVIVEQFTEAQSFASQTITNLS